MAMPICLRFERQTARRPRSLAELRAGSRRAASIAMIAMTTSSSISVNALSALPPLLACINTPTLRHLARFVKAVLISGGIAKHRRTGRVGKGGELQPTRRGVRQVGPGQDLKSQSRLALQRE